MPDTRSARAAHWPSASLRRPGGGAERDADADGSVLHLWLALKLALLSVFIALVAISPIEPQKARRVVDSVAASFRPPLVAPFGPSIAAVDPVGAAATRTMSDFASTLVAQFPDGDAAIGRPENGAEFDVAVATLFETLDDRPDPRLLAVGDRLAAADRALPVGHRLQINALLVLPKTAAAAERVLAEDRAAALAALFVSRGLPAEAVTVGIGEGSAARVTFAIAARPSPQHTLSSPEQP